MWSKLYGDLLNKSRSEPFAQMLGMEAVEVGEGFAKVRMKIRPELKNIFGSTHGGALFALIDEAFQLACNSHGVLSVALNVSVTYVARPAPGATLEAIAKEQYITRRTASYLCETVDLSSGELLATAQALAYRTGKEVESVME